MIEYKNIHIWLYANKKFQTRKNMLAANLFAREGVKGLVVVILLMTTCTCLPLQAWGLWWVGFFKPNADAMYQHDYDMRNPMHGALNIQVSNSKEHVGRKPFCARRRERLSRGHPFDDHLYLLALASSLPPTQNGPGAKRATDLGRGQVHRSDFLSDVLRGFSRIPQVRLIRVWGPPAPSLN